MKETKSNVRHSHAINEKLKTSSNLQITHSIGKIGKSFYKKFGSHTHYNITKIR